MPRALTAAADVGAAALSERRARADVAGVAADRLSILASTRLAGVLAAHGLLLAEAVAWLLVLLSELALLLLLGCEGTVPARMIVGLVVRRARFVALVVAVFSHGKILLSCPHLLCLEQQGLRATVP